MTLFFKEIIFQEAIFQVLFFITSFVIGACVGSFLNCIIYRLETNKSFLTGRSFCPACGHILSFKDLIPILSFLILKEKCRYCQRKISFQYPLVELITGFLFSLFFIFKNYSIVDLFFYWTISAFLILIFVFDLKHYLVPEKAVLIAILLTFIYKLFSFQFFNLILGVLPTLFFLFLVLVSKETWMGWGDVEIVFLMGLILGWPQILVALFFSFFLGALVGLILIFLKKKSFKSQIPFGPFLVTGTFFSIFFGQIFLDFYLNLFLL